jgi:hypothetical protein
MCTFFLLPKLLRYVQHWKVAAEPKDLPRCLHQPSHVFKLDTWSWLELRRGYTTDTSGVHHIRFRGACIILYTLGSVAVLVVTIAPVAHLASVYQVDHATSEVQ